MRHLDGTAMFTHSTRQLSYKEDRISVLNAVLGYPDGEVESMPL